MKTKSQYTDYNITTPQNVDSMIFTSGLESTLNKAKKDAFFCLNLCVNRLKFDTLPAGFDLYILSFWEEVFDDEWFLQVYNTHSNAEFIILGSFYHPGDFTKYNRVKFFSIFDYKWFPNQIENKPEINWDNKKYKISSLSYYVNETRYFITASLLDSHDALFSWHNQFRTLSPFEYIFQPTGNPLRDSLLSKKSRLENVYSIDTFTYNETVNNLVSASTNPAYSQCVVNCINETKDVSWQENFGVCPGPYFTEKTWKSLYNGCALIFSGQAKTKSTLEELGFNFDYPWNNDYSEWIGDLDRIEAMIQLIFDILDMPMEELINGVKDSCMFNQNHFFNGDFSKKIDAINNESIAMLDKYLSSKN